MKKKIYSTPLMEVEQINLSKCLLDASPANSSTDSLPVTPPGPAGATQRRTPVF